MHALPLPRDNRWRAGAVLLLHASAIATLAAQLAAAPPVAQRNLPAAPRLDYAWELTDSTRRSPLRLLPHLATYALPARYSSDINRQPDSPLPEYRAGESTGYRSVEMKLQVSIKTKVLEQTFGSQVDVWATYTQQAYLQLFSDTLSRPFRALDYAPGVTLNVPLAYELAGWRLQMAGLSWSHVSNGLRLPLSRSWNRVVAHLALTRGAWTVTLRPWLRYVARRDQNPRIERYVGRGDVAVTYAHGSHALTARLAHPFTPADIDRGYLEANWYYALIGDLNLHLQATTGYGQPLIDYNHLQSTVGVGVAFTPDR